MERSCWRSRTTGEGSPGTRRRARACRSCARSSRKSSAEGCRSTRTGACARRSPSRPSAPYRFAEHTVSLSTLAPFGIGLARVVVIGKRCNYLLDVAMAKFPVIVLFGVLIWVPLAAADLQPVNISPPGLSASRPLIATDGKGDLVAIWRELAGNAWSIRAASRAKGGAWHSKRISLPALVTESPALAMDRQGNAVAVWHRSDGSASVVQASVRPVGGDWSAAEDLSAPGEPAFDANVSAEAGNLAAVWVVLRDRQTRVLSSSRSVGGAWSPAEAVAGPVGNPNSPRIALDDHGGAVAAWRWSDGAYRVVEAASRAQSRP